MASGTVAADDNRHLRLDSLPLIDLHLLSQSELYSLSFTSSTSHPLRRCDDDVSIPKIDRSVFNESAGSRKQTYSRLRLASRKSKLSSSSSSSAVVVAPPPAEPLDQERFQIIGLLKKLFTDESSDGLVCAPVDYNNSFPEPLCEVMPNTPIDVVVDSGIKKRKRGRPRKDLVQEFACNVESGSPNSLLCSSGGDIGSVPVLSNAELSSAKPGSFSVPVDRVMEDSSAASIVGGQVKRKRGRPRKGEIRSVENAKGKDRVVVCAAKALGNGNGTEFIALGNVENPFEEELMKRTRGLTTEAELLGFLEGFEGDWNSWRRKKKTVNASELGNALPNGWRIMISFKRREGRFSLFCRRFVSPNGQQFVSYKEVSSYLLSSFGLQDASDLNPSLAECKIQEVACQVGSGDDANLSFDDAKTANELIISSRVPSTSTNDDWKQGMLLETINLGDVPVDNVLIKCQHHAMTFDEKNDLIHHLFSSHKDANGCNSVFCEGLIFNNGNYECQFCHKILDEKFCHNDNVATRVKDDVESIEVSQGMTSTLKKSNPSVSGISPTSLHMKEPIGIDKEQPSTMPVKDEVGSGELKEEIVTKICHSLRGQDSCIQTTDRGEVANTVNYNNEDKDIYEHSDGMNLVAKCITNGSMEEPKLDMDTQAGIFSSEETICGIDDFECHQFTSGVENRNGESISGHCGIGNEEECATVKDENEFLGSNLMDSVHQKHDELGFCDSLIDEKTHLVSGTSYESRNIGSSSDCVALNADALTIDDRNSESYFNVHEQDFGYVVNTQSPSFKIEEHWPQRSFQGDVFSAFSAENNATESSVGAVNVTNCKSSEFNVVFDNKDRRFQGQTISCMDQDRNSGRDSLLLSSYEDTFALEDSAACIGKIEKVDLRRDFLLNPFNYEQSYDGGSIGKNMLSRSRDDYKIKEVKCLSNNEVSHDFGSSYGGVGSSAATSTVKGMSSEGYSFDTSGSNRTFPIPNSVHDICNGTVKELEPERNSEIGLIYPSSDQIHAVGDNLDSGSTGTHWQRPVTSSIPMQMSGHYLNSSVISDEDAYGNLSVDEKFEMIDLEGLGSGNADQLLYNFLSRQGTPSSNESKGFTHKEMNQGFDSSLRLSDEASTFLPKTSSRHQNITICVWCGEECYYEGVSSGTEYESMGIMCTTCQAKFSN
ncbi:uncharacterized protein LOC115709758 [Cannabis sativa]|uniref:uncharacterized protein LOC115709758 n=1 Tax=Cannabis sativa TaxID=3483 RepID=UPI0029CA061C|nr:uncharacterized protein LOC115709758 [Cannabis sativa]